MNNSICLYDFWNFETKKQKFLTHKNFIHNLNEKTEESNIQNGIDVIYQFIKYYFKE